MNRGIIGGLALTAALTAALTTAPAQAFVTITPPYPAKVRMVDQCLDFEPTIRGQRSDLVATVVTAAGTRYPSFYCPGGRTLRLMKRTIGLTFTVNYRYTRDLTAVGTKQPFTVFARDWGAGAGDLGDVHVAHGAMVIECKGGKAAESASWRQLADWWAETEREASRVAACDLAVLVVKRKGSGKARDWRAFVRVDEYLYATKAMEVHAPRVVEMPLGGLIADLVAADWGQS